MSAPADDWGTWRPIDTAPRDGSCVLIAGPSGNTQVTLRVSVCRYYPAFPYAPWRSIDRGDSFTEGGDEPTLWHPMLRMPSTTVSIDLDMDELVVIRTLLRCTPVRVRTAGEKYLLNRVEDALATINRANA